VNKPESELGRWCSGESSTGSTSPLQPLIQLRSRCSPGARGNLGELRAAGVDLFLHQQAVDTTTPSGRAMFQMLRVFAEFEWAMIQEEIKAGFGSGEGGREDIGKTEDLNRRAGYPRGCLERSAHSQGQTVRCEPGQGPARAGDLSPIVAACLPRPGRPVKKVQRSSIVGRPVGDTSKPPLSSSRGRTPYYQARVDPPPPRCLTCRKPAILGRWRYQGRGPKRGYQSSRALRPRASWRTVERY
jgi:hypothetical protein